MANGCLKNNQRVRPPLLGVAPVRSRAPTGVWERRPGPVAPVHVPGAPPGTAWAGAAPAGGWRRFRAEGGERDGDDRAARLRARGGAPERPVVTILGGGRHR